MNELKFTGVVEFISEPTKGTSTKGEWTKQYVVIKETEGQYPKRMKVDVFNKPEEMAKVSIGSKVTAHINPECRDWNNTHIGSIGLWKFTDIEEPKVNVAVEENKDNDLPF